MPKRGCGGDGARVAPQHRRIPTMSASRLTETQWMVLSAASQRNDHCAMLPPRLRGGAAQKVVKKLLDLGLVEAVRARGDVPVWRREDDGCALALRLTSRGLERIQAIMAVTGWQPHSVRGFFSGVVRRKLGLDLASNKAGDQRLYRIVRIGGA